MRDTTCRLAWRYTHAANPCTGRHTTDTEWDVEESAEFVRYLDEWATFHETVEQLPLIERGAVSLILYHGWTQDQVAELFQASVRTIRQRWKSAQQELQSVVRQG